MVALAANRIAAMGVPHNIAVMEQIARAKVPTMEEEILALFAEFIDLAFHSFQSHKGNYLHLFNLEMSLQA
jgi:hypothetical protein